MSTVFHGWRRNATVATVATLAVIVACAWYRNYLDTRVIEAARSMYSHDLPSPEAEPVLPAQEPQVGGVDAGEGEDLPDIVGTVERVVYDRPSQSLFVRLSIEDRSARSLFVVANEFCLAQ